MYIPVWLLVVVVCLIGWSVESRVSRKEFNEKIEGLEHGSYE